MDAHSIHNKHQEDPTKYSELDENLNKLKTHALVYIFPLLEKLPINKPGIYTLCGTHGVGKTTLLKQWIEKLLTTGITEKDIVFLSGSLIKNYHELKNLLQKQAANCIIIDDIITIHDWEKTINNLMGGNQFQQKTLMISGADNNINQKIKTTADFHLYPLSFRESVLLTHGQEQPQNILFTEFERFLIHGGNFNAINEMASQNNLSDSTLQTYAQWVCQEVVKRGKSENYLREILAAIIKHYNEQITWNALAQELTIDHPKTIGDYLAMLEAMDVVFVQYALLEDTLQPAPKKARKLMFKTPFIFHAIQAWLASGKNYFSTQIQPTLENAELCSKLVVTSVISQLARYHPAYYIKAEGEVDLAYIQDQRFWPIEITWASQMRAKDLKQILKYQNGRILTKTERSGIIDHIRTEPLPLALWQLEQ